MAHSPNLYPIPRPPRVKLAGSVLALIQFGDHQQVRAKLHQLNINGGLLHLPEPLEEQAPVRVMFHVGSTTVRAGAETITPFWATKGWLQPFRFTEFDEDDRRRLDADLLTMLGMESRGSQEHEQARDVQQREEDSAPPPAYSDQELRSDEQRSISEQLAPVTPYEGEAVAPQYSGGPAEEACTPETEVNEVPDYRSEVILYFDRREDAIRFTVALSSVIFCEQGNRSRDDIARLAREFAKISRVTT
jgi:hypothetical protein